jgi:hypothetical protein
MPEREIRFKLSGQTDAEFQQALQFWKDNFDFTSVRHRHRVLTATGASSSGTGTRRSML